MNILPFIFWCLFSIGTCNLQDAQFYHFILRTLHHDHLNLYNYAEVISLINDLKDISPDSISHLELDETTLVFTFLDGSHREYALSPQASKNLKKLFQPSSENSVLPLKSTSSPCCPHQTTNTSCKRDDDDDETS